MVGAGASSARPATAEIHNRLDQRRATASNLGCRHSQINFEVIQHALNRERAGEVRSRFIKRIGLAGFDLTTGDKPTRMSALKLPRHGCCRRRRSEFGNRQIHLLIETTTRSQANLRPKPVR